jgi:hypothetical protein
MPDTAQHFADTVISGPSCASSPGAGMSRSARRARALAGFGFLALAGALGSRQGPG